MTYTELETPHNGEHEATVERTGEQIVEKSLTNILDIQETVTTSLHLEANSAQAVRATDQALIYISENTLSNPGSTSEERDDSVFSIAIETALEEDSGIHGLETPVAGFVGDGFRSAITSIAEKLGRTHATLPSGHEAAPLVMQALNELDEDLVMAEEGKVEYVDTSVNPNKVERRFDSDDKLSEEAYKVVENLRIQRQQQGDYIASNAADNIKKGHVLQPVYSTFEANSFNGDPEASPQDVIAVLRELDSIAKHEATQAVRFSGTQHSKENFEESVNRSSLSALLQVEPHLIPELKKMGGQDGQFFRRLYGQAEKKLEDLPERNRMLGEAQIQGFRTVKEKYDAMINGEIPEEDGFLEKGYLEVIFSGRGFELEPTEATNTSIDYLSEHLGLPEGLSSEIFLSIQSKVTRDYRQFEKSDAEIPTASKSRLQQELSNIGEKINSIGAENAARLRNECGIVNFGELSTDQLDRMVRFIDNDPELTQELSSREVCVVIRDATSDWNGAFKDSYKTYEPEDGVMLAFEISSMAESGKQMREISQLLIDRGIDPSVLVIAGHGSPGLVQFGDGLLLAREPKYSPQEEYSTIENSGLGDLMGSMRPDRDGNSHIIYHSCSSGGTFNESFAEPLMPDNPALAPLQSTEDLELAEQQLGARPTAESTLAYTARIAHKLNPNTTYQVSGVDRPSNMRVDVEGKLRYRDHVATRIIAPEGSDEQYRLYDESVSIPMFLRHDEEALQRQKAQEAMIL
ncbi:MAG: hypothetical protein V4611_02960 [Patescibacteria group bacterium]